MADVRFAGSPAAEAANFLTAPALPFPVAFDDPAMRPERQNLQEAFDAVAAPLRAGSPAPGRALVTLRLALDGAELDAAPVVRDLPFDDAVASREFLNQLRRAADALKAPTAPRLANPDWTTDGDSVAALVQFMAKNKLKFGPAPAHGAESYFTLHRALATYLFVLTEPKK
jgi:hypothetical protein